MGSGVPDRSRPRARAAKRRVLVVTGDGEMLMGLGSLATIGAQRPWQPRSRGARQRALRETGMQKTHTALRNRSRCGRARVRVCHRSNHPKKRRSFGRALGIYRGKGPLFFQVKVKADALPLVLPPRDGADLKHRFREALLGAQ